ncbi:MAG TPA: hypothetical protein VFL90_03965 [Methylomirabilota bacterium]|nr:hypothetical protein [Methylomirabilota bacterium]
MNMHTRMVRIVLLAAVLALTLAQASAWAETSTLSPKDQKIARALFEAQSTSGGAQPLTVDQISALKAHKGWGDVFKDMKSKGLLTEKNLGQVVSAYEKHHPETAKLQRTDKPDKADKPGKPDKPERMDKPDRPEKPGR